MFVCVLVRRSGGGGGGDGGGGGGGGGGGEWLSFHLEGWRECVGGGADIHLHQGLKGGEVSLIESYFIG